MIKKLAEIAATRIGSTKAKREAVLQVKQTEVAEQQAKVMACQKELDALVEKEALKVQASVCPSCRSTFGHHILGVPAPPGNDTVSKFLRFTTAVITARAGSYNS